MFPVLILALVGICAHAQTVFVPVASRERHGDCAESGCLTQIENAVRTCSAFDDASPFMDCVRTYPAHSQERRHCLNLQGLPQLDICGDPTMGVHDLVKCFTSVAAADESWEECVVKQYIKSAVSLTKLEKSFVTCTDIAKNAEFVRCVSSYPMNSGIRRNCLNRNGSPQLDVCAGLTGNDRIVSCFRGAAADERWEECVVSEFLGVYTQPPIVCSTQLDTHYLNEFRKMKITGDRVHGIISWVKQGRLSEEYRSIEYFEKYAKKCWYPGRLNLPAIPGKATKESCEMDSAKLCAAITSFCIDRAQKYKESGYIRQSLALKVGCAAFAPVCPSVNSETCNLLAKEKEPNACLRACWTIRYGCGMRVICNARVFYTAYIIFHGCSCRTPSLLKAPETCKVWKTCGFASVECQLKAAKSCQSTNKCNAEANKCADRGCCLGKAIHKLGWGYCRGC